MPEQIIAEAPGRINVIGEHTDYNDGFVLPASIDKKTRVKLKKKHSGSISRISSSNMGSAFVFDIRNFEKANDNWQNYVMGVVCELQKIGAQIGAFDCEISGNVPLGSGMSSSAALECSLAIGLNALFDLGLDKIQLIKVCQAAENNFVGMKCGIMDQFTSVMGKRNKVIKLDCRSLEYQYFPLNLDQYDLLLLNTNVSHNLASSAYNERRNSCELAVQQLSEIYPEVISLRDVCFHQLQNARNIMDTETYRRSLFVIKEIERVQLATKALENGELEKLGLLMYASHEGLQNDYEVSCPQLDFLVDYSRDKNFVIGSRMMGGGFGGCTINIVHKDYIQNYKSKISQVYKDNFRIDLTPYEVKIEDGAVILDD